MKKTFAVLLIIAGISIALYPEVKWGYSRWQQEKVMHELEEYMNKEDTDTAQPESGSGNNGNTQNDSSKNKQTSQDDKASEIRDEYIKKHLEGILKIPRINLNMPVLKGATNKNLAISPSSIEGTGKAGEFCNYCIAGHHSYLYGHQFNRLGELKVGDKIIFQSIEGVFTYTVRNIYLVHPTDTSHLKPQKGQRLITLITCDYRLKPTGRLLVTGAM